MSVLIAGPPAARGTNGAEAPLWQAGTRVSGGHWQRGEPSMAIIGRSRIGNTLPLAPLQSHLLCFPKCAHMCLRGHQPLCRKLEPVGVLDHLGRARRGGGLCGIGANDWCPAPPGDSCGRHRNVAACRADPACCGNQGKSLVACQLDGRGLVSIRPRPAARAPARARPGGSCWR
jgi:hypothetical protein